MKKYLALVLAVLMVFSLCACGGGDGGSGDEKVIKIGVYEPQTGANGAGGKQEILGMQYANEKCPTVEIGGETYKVELVYADNESTNEKAVSAATELIAEGVSVVLGSYGSGVSIAASDTFKEAGVPAIGVTCTNPQVTEGNEHYFRICFLDPFQGTVHANFAKDELKATKVYCLGELGNDYDQGLINTSFGGAFEMMPGVAYLYAGGDSKDARAVAAEIQKEARRLTEEGINEDFYQRVRRASFGSNLRGLNSFENIAVSLSEGYFHGYDPLRFPQVFDTITKDDITAFLRENLTADRAVLSEIVPK